MHMSIVFGFIFFQSMMSLRRRFNILGASWLALGFVLRTLKAIVGPPGAFLEPCCGLVRPIWAILGPLGAIFGAILKPLGAILGTLGKSCGNLEALWGLLGSSRSHLGTTVGQVD